MDYKINDLAKMTGFSPARIRKWQERFHILEPKCAKNGYWYYSNQDLYVLKNIKTLLDKGDSLVTIMNKGRDSLLNMQGLESKFTSSELKFIRAISENNIPELESELTKKKSENFDSWIKRLSNSLILVGEAWANKQLSIADEHFFTHFLQGFFMEYIRKFENKGNVTCLVVSFPGDQHTTGALLNYGHLLYQKKAVRYCGMLPEEELFRELSGGAYSELFISVTLPRKISSIEKLSTKLSSRFSSLAVYFGGQGINRKIQPQNSE